MHRLLPKFSSCLAAIVLLGAAGVITAAPAAATGPCTTTCYVDAATGNDANGGNAGDPFLTIQHGIDSVAAGGTVNVRPGSYDETATNRTITQSNGGPNGPHQFGLFVPATDAGITVQGVTSGDVPITSPGSVQAHITTNATNDFGYAGTFIEGDNVTMQGLAFGVNNPGQDKTIEVIGNNFTLNASDIEDYYGSVYLDDWMYDSNTETPSVTTYNITNNIFRHGVTLDIASGPGGGTNGGPASGRVISGNNFEGDTNPESCAGCTTGEVYWPAVSFNGAGTTVPWFVDPVGAAAISGNTFGASDQYIRHRHGPPDTAFTNWGSYWTGNTFARAAIATTDGNPNHVASYSYSSSFSFPAVERIGGTIQATHATGCAGADCDGELTHTPVNGTLLLSAGTFNEVVNVGQKVTVKGVQAGVDARTRSGSESILAPSLSAPAGRTPLEVSASDVTIDGLTVRDNTYDNLYGTGVRLDPGIHGTQFVNNIVRNNISGLFLTNDQGSDPALIQHNLFADNTNAGSASGTDIYADQFTAGVGGVNGATINQNTFTNTSFVEAAWALGISNTDSTRFTGITFSNNTIDNHGRGGYFYSTTASTATGNTFVPGASNHYGFGVFSTGGADSNTNISIDHNVLGCATSCAGTGGLVDDPAATGLTIVRNNLQGLSVGISNSNATPTVDGTCNWWGQSSGPSGGQTVGSVTSAPWIITSNLNSNCVPIVKIGNATVPVVEGNSGNTAVNLTVSLDRKSNQTVTVQWNTLDGTAAYPDYVGAFGTKTFAPGETTKTITVQVHGDTALEDYEYFSVKLSNPTNAFLANSQEQVEIQNDELPTLSVNNPSVTEGGVAVFMATVAQRYYQPINLSASSANGTAHAPGDYGPVTNKPVTIAAGTTSKNVSMQTNTDGVTEGSETFSLTFTSVSVNNSPQTGTATIQANNT